jgi:hypothetical protein
MVLAPTIAEVLPGATRFSSLFVLPIEICVWGGGALMIREAVRRWRLGWGGYVLLGLALAVAEEGLIQQTSLAPMVLKLKGVEYARAVGVNYVYLLWALVYETVFVVLVPVALTELVVSRRREEQWIGRRGMTAVMVFFAVGCFLAWFSWTRFARPNVFHVPIYNPPAGAVLAASVSICGLIVGASLGRGIGQVRPLTPPNPVALGMVGGGWAVFWYGLVLLAFGIAPEFPPALAVAAGLFVAFGMLFVLPRWLAHQDWGARHTYGVVAGSISGSMLVGFVGFIGATPYDLGFKILADLMAFWFLYAIWRRVCASQATTARQVGN